MMNKPSAIRGQRSASRAGTSSCRCAPVGTRTCRFAVRAFTLTELLVAIAVLVIVIIGTSKIFGTASQVAGLGQANQDLLATAAAIEQRLREDLSRLSREGFLAIHCVAVQNDFHGPAAPLINPNVPPGAVVRADQLVFFATGVESSQTFGNVGSNHKGQGTVSRVYYGHGFQLSNTLPFDTLASTAHDPNLQPGGAITPWWRGNVTMVNTLYTTGTGTNNFSRTVAPGTLDGTQPGASQWLLLRQPVALVDDDTGANNENSKTVYLGQVVTARSIFVDGPPGFGFSREIRNGRVDAAATLPSEIRRWVTFSGVNLRPWSAPVPLGAGGNQRNVIQSAVYWPRAERVAPSMHRVDQALTNAVIAAGCSSFIVEWTYEGSDFQRVDANGNIVGGIGEVLDANGNVIDPTPAAPNSGDELTGVIVARAPLTSAAPGVPNGEQPWFGLADSDRGVLRYADLPAGGAGPLRAASTILPLATFPNNIESFTAGLPAGLTDYWALFGYNQDRPLDPVTGLPDVDLAYTPWPTAIRVTMVLHDPQGRLESGREFQFVIDLPRRRN